MGGGLFKVLIASVAWAILSAGLFQFLGRWGSDASVNRSGFELIWVFAALAALALGAVLRAAESPRRPSVLRCVKLAPASQSADRRGRARACVAAYSSDSLTIVTVDKGNGVASNGHTVVICIFLEEQKCGEARGARSLLARRW
jgi:hypothetical protein